MTAVRWLRTVAVREVVRYALYATFMAGGVAWVFLMMCT